MRTDLKYKLTLSALISIIPLVLSGLMLFIAYSNPIWLGLFPIYLFAASFILMIVFGFIPFLKDHMWLSALIVVLFSVASGLIFKLFI